MQSFKSSNIEGGELFLLAIRRAGPFDSNFEREGILGCHISESERGNSGLPWLRLQRRSHLFRSLGFIQCSSHHLISDQHCPLTTSTARDQYCLTFEQIPRLAFQLGLHHFDQLLKILSDFECYEVSAHIGWKICNIFLLPGRAPRIV